MFPVLCIQIQSCGIRRRTGPHPSTTDDSREPLALNLICSSKTGGPECDTNSGAEHDLELPGGTSIVFDLRIAAVAGESEGETNNRFVAEAIKGRRIILAGTRAVKQARSPKPKSEKRSAAVTGAAVITCDTSAMRNAKARAGIKPVNASGSSICKTRSAVAFPAVTAVPGRFLPRLGPPAKVARSFFSLNNLRDCGCLKN